jgi:hypothetical protein
MMKKTSLLLAIGALLYGAEGSYTFADEVLHQGMSPEEVVAFLNTITFTTEEEVIPEDAPDSGGASPAGLDPAQALPKNVSIVNNTVIKKPAMCNPNSFPVTGDEMEGILVTVTFGSHPTLTTTTESVRWVGASPTPSPPLPPPPSPVGYAAGSDWVLAEGGDTWNHRWVLVTGTGVSITKIVINALNVQPAKGRVYAFDVGGKIPRAPAPASPQHTPGSARGQFIKQTVPTPPPIFTATYSDPVYVGHTADSTAIPLAPPYGPGGPPADRKPTHDLYGTLTIDFITPPPPTPPVSTAIGSVTPLDVIDFAYIADTDCLPVKEGQVVSYNQETSTLVMKILAENDGLAAIMQRCDEDVSTVAGPFELTGENENTISTSLKLKSSCCYSLMDLDSLETVKLLGVNTNADDEVCAQ